VDRELAAAAVICEVFAEEFMLRLTGDAAHDASILSGAPLQIDPGLSRTALASSRRDYDAFATQAFCCVAPVTTHAGPRGNLQQ
jgi:hypothetical protein